MHAAIFVYVLGSWNSSRNWLTCSSNTTQTRLCLTVNCFAKSRLFSNIDLPKSRLKSTLIYTLSHKHRKWCSTIHMGWICFSTIAFKNVSTWNSSSSNEQHRTHIHKASATGGNMPTQYGKEVQIDSFNVYSFNDIKSTKTITKITAQIITHWHIQQLK